MVGRLSGQSIAMLDWSEMTHDTNGTAFCGSYADSWLSAGTYFIEVIVIHCNGFGLTALDAILSDANHTEEDLEQWRLYDFTYECVEEPSRHRITGKSAFVNVAEHHGSSFGHWVLLNETDGELNADPSSFANKTSTGKEWFTRYQPHNCMSPNSINQKSCKGPVDNSHIGQYRFEWVKQDWLRNISALQVDLGIDAPGNIYTAGKKYSRPISHEFDQRSDKLGNDGRRIRDYEMDVFYAPDKICLVGDSHSWHLMLGLYRLSLGHRFINAELTFPTTDPVDLFTKFYTERNCTSFVVALGQWPLSSSAPGGKPYTLELYRTELRDMVRNEELYSIGNGDIKVYLQALHQDPLGYKMSACDGNGKATDWRSFTAFDAYNYIQKEIVDEM